MKILIISGSSKKGSYNAKLANLVSNIVSEKGHQGIVLSHERYNLPLFSEDLESSDSIRKLVGELKQEFISASGLVFCSPEYNSSVTPLMKNIIDWASRTQSKDEPALQAYTGKVALILSASPGALGGLRGLVHLRAILGNLGVLVLPEQLAITAAHEAFSEDGKLKDQRRQETLSKYCQKLVDTCAKLA